ncbi:anti-sigma factor domain-containing protein [Pseudalkalibacillus sp. A8]|uniref:anti-sigma factor domain-containing protein n=1 Tax=Pseudalkalibacillus sp. A8 TaxID=3382641 RepID=UPI0038B61FBD
MKRGLIMEVSKRKAVILTKDGSFERVRLKKGEKPEVGQEYICPPEVSDAFFQPNRKLLPSFSLSLVAIIVFMLFAGGMPFQQNKASAAAYVSFDINPSIEVAVDKELNVIKVRALNEDAENLLDGSTDYENASLLLFSDSLFETLKEYGYFDTYDDLLIASSLDEDYVSPEMRKRLEDSIEKLKSSKYIENTGVILSVLETTEANRNVANENGLSMGKYLVFQDALAKDKTLTIQQVSSTPYSELKKLMMAKDEEVDEDKEQALPETVPDDRLYQTNHTKTDKANNGLVNKPEKTSDTPEKPGSAAADVAENKDSTDDTKLESVENEKENATLAEDPVTDPKNPVSGPAKKEVEKENEKESRSDSNKGKTSKNNDDEDDLQVKIKLDLQGLDKDELSPRELRLIESLQINIFNADGKSHGNGKSEKNRIHPQEDKHKKESHGKRP